MKKRLIAGIVFFAVAALAILVAITWRNSSRASARRAWKEKTVAEISIQATNPTWLSNGLAKLQSNSTTNSTDTDAWFSDQLILMKNGEWLDYASICRKQEGKIDDLFIAYGSDERWYYSTYHFCIDMIVLRMNEQPAGLSDFVKDYSLRTFDGKSDECLKKTWLPEKTKKTYSPRIDAAEFGLAETAARSGERGYGVLTDGGVQRILQFGATKLQLVDLLVGGVFNILLDATDFVVELVILLEHLPEFVVSETEATDDFTMFGELAEKRMVYVHGRLLVKVDDTFTAAVNLEHRIPLSSARRNLAKNIPQLPLA